MPLVNTSETNAVRMNFQYTTVSPLVPTSSEVFWDEVSMDGWNINFISLIHSFIDKFSVLHNSIFSLGQTLSLLNSAFKVSQLHIAADSSFLIQNKEKLKIYINRAGMAITRDHAKSFSMGIILFHTSQ